jgi:spore maturation protein A
MLNHIWFWMIIISVFIAAGYDINEALTEKQPESSSQELVTKKEPLNQKTKLGKVTSGAMNAAKTAFELAIGLIGVMALFLGIMKVAEESGIIQKLGYFIRPITKRLFPTIPPDHPVIGSMIMNMSANMLGLSNAATPMGLKAMEELQELNKQKDTASNDMITFLVINTSAITLIPATAIALRVKLGSTDPLQIMIPGIIAASVATIVGVTVVKLIQRIQKNKTLSKSQGGE